MQQMLDALMGQQGEGGNSGIGGGAGGGGEDGYSVAGNQSIPAYGPNRLEFSNPQSGIASNSGNSRPGLNGQRAKNLPSNSVDTDKFRKPAQASLSPENVPDKYRDAVKRYFTSDEKAED